MAHQTEIVINGVSTEVTEFDHTAQEIDDGIDKVNALTGEDIPTSASDSTSISSQLSNLEISKAPSGYGLGTNCTQITDWNTAISNGWYKTTTYDPGNNTPDGLAWYGLTINYSADILVQLAFHADSANSCRAAFRWQHAGAWSTWTPIATATPPQEFDLPLADGFVHYVPGTKSTYSKSQEGLVVVHFYCKKADGTDIVQNDTIAMLPEGFHPSANVHIPANVSYDGSSVYSQDVATAVADPTGRVWIEFPPAGCKAVTTTLVFYAAS